VSDRLDSEVFDESDFSDMTRWTHPGEEWPAYRRIAVFSVTGGSEGHDVYIEALTDDRRILLGL
jgi:hypothetical protein